jgi:hypothetical protein
LEVAPRGTLDADISAVAGIRLEDLESEDPFEPDEYLVLDAGQVQCCAAANASLAAAAQTESDMAGSGCRQSAQRDLKRKILRYREVDERNRDAARALEAFYLLAEAEINGDVLQRSLTEAAKTLDFFDQLEREGLEIEAEQQRNEAFGQRVELLDRRAELEKNLRELDGQLRQLLGLSSDNCTPIWPAADLTVTAEPIDVDAAVSLGLAQRADIGLLCTLIESLDPSTLTVVRSAMGQIDGLLGTSGPAGRLRMLLARRAIRDEVETRRHQLCQLLADRQRAAVEEIRQAAYTVETRLEQIVIAGENARHQRERAEALRQRRGVPDGPTAFDIQAAELQAIRAESDAVHQVIAWRIALVKLKEVQGLLAYECGYDLPPCGCCAATLCESCGPDCQLGIDDPIPSDSCSHGTPRGEVARRGASGLQDPDTYFSASL